MTVVRKYLLGYPDEDSARDNDNNIDDSDAERAGSSSSSDSESAVTHASRTDKQEPPAKKAKLASGDSVRVGIGGDGKLAAALDGGASPCVIGGAETPRAEHAIDAERAGVAGASPGHMYMQDHI